MEQREFLYQRRVAMPDLSHHQQGGELTAQDNPILQRILELRQLGRLRLDLQESQALAYALAHETGVDVAVFGSRTQPDRRGGDIDLLVLGKVPEFETSQRIATRFFSRCEEKIDVIVINPETATSSQQAFLNNIKTVPLS